MKSVQRPARTAGSRTRRRWRSPRAFVALGGALAGGGLLVGLVFLAQPASNPARPTEPASTAVPPTLVDDFPPDPLLTAPTAVAPSSQTAPATNFERIADVPVPSPREGLTSYAVQPGDVLWQIAERFGLRSETLVWSNDLTNADLLAVGQQLVVPPGDGVLYAVQPGDSLAEVAANYSVEVDSIVRANRLVDPDRVVAGLELFLPDARPLQGSTVASRAGVARAPEADQETAAAVPAVPLPDNIDALLRSAWLRTVRATPLFKSAEPSVRLQDLPPGTTLERLEGAARGQIQVRTPGDGRTRQAMTGWIAAVDLDVGRALAARELPQAYPADSAMDIAHIFAPYRSQLDGAPYAQANCGPATIGMALETFGINVSSRQLRSEALAAQRVFGDNVGTLITALSDVVQQHGLQTLDLTDANGALRRWSVDDIRSHAQRGHPVVVQVRYRALPGRQNSGFAADHYILVTGVVGDRFLYNDAIDADGVGWDRIITADRLQTAMNASDRRFAYSAFAVAR